MYNIIIYVYYNMYLDILYGHVSSDLLLLNDANNIYIIIILYTISVTIRYHQTSESRTFFSTIKHYTTCFYNDIIIAILL